MARVESLLDAQGRIGSGGISSDITEKTVWEFTGNLYNNSMRDQALVKYMPSANAEGAYTLESMQAYANNVFGIENLTFVDNYYSAELSDGTYTFYGIQNGDLNTSRIKTVNIDGDAYTVTGVASIGMIYDLNQQGPAYEPETTYEFTMNLVKNPDSPFGFRLVSISYEQGNMDDLNSSEPPVVNGVAASGDSATTENSDSTDEFNIDMKASVIDPNTTDPTMLKYLEIINGVCKDNKWPDGSEVDRSGIGGDLSINWYGVLDIDDDGRKELAIKITNTATADYALKVFDYDATTDTLKVQYSSLPTTNVYGNGILKRNDTHNHSLSWTVWPYVIFQYDRETDTYLRLAFVCGVEKDMAGDQFNASYDVDGDGLYYDVEIYENGDVNQCTKKYMDNSEFKQCNGQYIDEELPTAEVVAEPMSNVLR